MIFYKAFKYTLHARKYTVYISFMYRYIYHYICRFYYYLFTHKNNNFTSSAKMHLIDALNLF